MLVAAGARILAAVVHHPTRPGTILFALKARPGDGQAGLLTLEEAVMFAAVALGAVIGIVGLATGAISI